MRSRKTLLALLACAHRGQPLQVGRLEIGAYVLVHLAAVLRAAGDCAAGGLCDRAPDGGRVLGCGVCAVPIRLCAYSGAGEGGWAVGVSLPSTTGWCESRESTCGVPVAPPGR